MLKTLISGVKAMTAVFALLLAFTVSASAQDRAANGAQKLTDKMKTELSLNDEQYNKVLEINKSYSDKAVEARKSSTDRAVTATAVKGLNEESDTKLKAVLTDDQYKTYLANKQAKREAFKGRIAEGKELRKLNVAPAQKQ